MAIHIQTRKKSIITDEKSANIQYIPFQIHADCDAKVRKYFQSLVTKEEDTNTLKASFRGYPLKGKVLELPKNYVGLVLHESSKPATEKEERKFFPIHIFKLLTYWNWDKNPSQNDVIMQAFDWIDIAEALHAPVIEE